MTLGTLTIIATGAMSRMKLKLRLLVKRRIDRVRGGDHQERIAVRGRLHDRLGGDIAAGSRPVLDDKMLAKPLRQPLSDQARENVGRSHPAQNRRSSAPAETDRLAPTQRATPPEARQRPQPDAEIVGGEVSSRYLSSRAASFDHLVGGDEQARRHGEAEHSGGLGVDDKVELRRLHYRQVGRFSSFQNAANIDGRPDATRPSCSPHS